MTNRVDQRPIRSLLCQDNSGRKRSEIVDPALQAFCREETDKVRAALAAALGILGLPYESHIAFQTHYPNSEGAAPPDEWGPDTEVGAFLKRGPHSAPVLAELFGPVREETLNFLEPNPNKQFSRIEGSRIAPIFRVVYSTGTYVIRDDFSPAEGTFPQIWNEVLRAVRMSIEPLHPPRGTGNWARRPINNFTRPGERGHDW